MNEQDRNRIRDLLLRERSKVFDALGHFEDQIAELRETAGELTLYDQHMAESATSSQNQEERYLLADVEGQRLYAIDEALSKLYKEPERFGKCENCGREIEMERLELVPSAKLCMACQRGAEEEEEA